VINRRRRAHLVYVLLAAGYIGAMWQQPAGFYDEGLIVSGTDRILHGQHPYVDALFPFLAERRHATRYDMWLPGVMNAAPAQSEVVRELESSAVAYVVLFAAPSSDEPNSSSIDSGVRILDDYLARRYRIVNSRCLAGIASCYGRRSPQVQRDGVDQIEASTVGMSYILNFGSVVRIVKRSH